MNCCDDYINLGCFDSCDTIILLYQATETGIHTIIIKHNGYYHSYKVTFTSGDYFTIDLSKFAENGESVFQILMPSGDYFTTVDNDMQINGCFKVDLSSFSGVDISENIEIETYFILQENGFKILQENGGGILQE